jgi:O-Antigen ligase
VVVRRAGLSGACAALLVGPTVLAFFTGGYFDGPRLVAGVIAWILVAVCALAAPRPLPRTAGGWLALVGLALLAAWTLVSFTWAPVAGPAYHAGQRVALYVGVLFAAAALLRGRGSQRAVEPVLAAGTLVVIGYGLSERLLPGLLHFSRSVSAQGRLEQPLTYWNAMGEVAAIGLVLSVRIGGDASRPRWLRIVAGAAAAPLGMGLYVTFSRGALFACFAGLVTLIVLAPTRLQLRAMGSLLLAAALAAVAVAPLHRFDTLSGSQATREAQGTIALALLAAIALVAALAQWRLTRAGASRTADATVPLPRQAGWLALGLICSSLAVAIVVGAKESAANPQLRPGTTRYATLNSSRYAYWKVALRAFGDEPLRGVGAEGWAVYWLRYRTIEDFAQDAHSLEIQTLAELGLIGAALLLAFLGGVALAARDAWRAAPALAAGPIGGFVAYVAHSPLDWDWQLPAVTLIALVLAGMLVAIADSVKRGPQGAGNAPAGADVR